MDQRRYHKKGLHSPRATCSTWSLPSTIRCPGTEKIWREIGSTIPSCDTADPTLSTKYKRTSERMCITTRLCLMKTGWVWFVFSKSCDGASISNMGLQFAVRPDTESFESDYLPYHACVTIITGIRVWHILNISRSDAFQKLVMLSVSNAHPWCYNCLFNSFLPLCWRAIVPFCPAVCNEQLDCSFWKHFPRICGERPRICF